MNSIYSRVSHVRTWIVPAVALAVIIAVLLYLTVSDTGRGLVGLATGTTVTCESLTVGTPITGTVSASPGYDCYDFAADDPAIQGTTISVSLNSKSGSSLDADLYAPGSEVALGNTGYAWVTAFGTETKSGTLALDKGTGSYKIKVWSYSKSLGDYEVSVSMPTSPESQSAPSQASESTTVCNDVSLDTAVSGNIAGSNKFDCYTFTASENDNVIIKMTSKDGTSLDADLYAPGSPVTESNAGFKWATASSATPEATLSTSLDKGDGTYTVKAWSYGNAAEGNYELTISIGSETISASPSISETCGVLKIGDSASGTISSADKYDCYKYSAKSGDVVTVDITSLSGAQLDVDIFGPGSSTYADGAGYYWVSTQGTSKISKPVTLDKGDGEYIIKAWSYGNTATGGYELKISSESVAKTSAETSATSTDSAGAGPTTQPVATTTTEAVVKKSSRPEPLSQAERIVAVIGAPTNIDPITGCGHRAYSQSNGHLLYPDGIYRAHPTGKYVYEWPRNYDYWPELNEKMKAEGKDVTPGKGYENRILYWNDWLGLSPDIDEFRAERNTDRGSLTKKVNDFKGYLASTDDELLKKFGSWSSVNSLEDIDDLRDSLKYSHDHYENILLNTEVIFHGYPLIYPEKPSSNLTTSAQIDDVGYWDFAEAGVNTVTGGYDWDFHSNDKGEDVLFHDGILDVPYLAGDAWGVSGNVSLKPSITDKGLHRDKFTLAFAVLPEVLPNEMPVSGSSDFHKYHSPSRLLFSFGTYYRWLRLNINELCQLEVSLNMTPPGDYRKHNAAFLVSQVKLDIKRWNEIQFTINIPEKQASLTVLNGSEFPNETEIFTLPDDFEWSFAEDLEKNKWSHLPNVDHVDNTLGLYNAGGSGTAFGGKLDWIYLANGVLDPKGVERRVGPLRESEPAVREPSKISVSPDGYSASAELSAFEYPEWVQGASVNSSMQSYLMKDVYSHFKDDFDFVFLVMNEGDTSLQYDGAYRGVSNNVMGISEDEEGYDATKYVGSDGKLKSIIHFPLKWGVGGGPSLHELMHHWGNYALATGSFAAEGFDTSFMQPEFAMDGLNSGSHWGVSSVNGQLGGFDLSTLKELGDNWYSADPFGLVANGGNSIPYGNFELYLMGLIPPDEVDDVVLFRGISATAGDFFDEQKWYADKKVIVTVEDIIEKLGPRAPDHNKSQKEFRILTLVLTDDPLTEEEWTDFSKQAKDFEDTFSWATGNRATAKLGELDKSLKPVEEFFGFLSHPHSSASNVAWDPEMGISVSVRKDASSDTSFDDLTVENLDTAFAVSLCSDENCKESESKAVSGETKYLKEGSSRFISFVPDAPLFGGKHYRVEVSDVANVKYGSSGTLLRDLVNTSDWTFTTAKMTQFALPVNLKYDNSVCVGSESSGYSENKGQPMCQNVDQLTDSVFGMEQGQINHYFNTQSKGKFVISPIRDRNGHVRPAIEIDRKRDYEPLGLCFRVAELDAEKRSYCPAEFNVLEKSVKDQLDDIFDFKRYKYLKYEDGTDNLLAPFLPSREYVLNTFTDERWHPRRNVVPIYNFGTFKKATLGQALMPSKSQGNQLIISNEESLRTWIHELGHAMFALPDLYYTGTFGPSPRQVGLIDIMGDNAGKMPPLSAWSLMTSELMEPVPLISDKSMTAFLDGTETLLSPSCGTVAKPCLIYDNTQTEFDIIKVPAIIERDTREIKGHYLIEFYGSSGYNTEIELAPKTVAFSDIPGSFPGGIAIWKVDDTEQKVKTSYCQESFPGNSNCDVEYIRDNGTSQVNYPEYYPSLPTTSWHDIRTSELKKRGGGKPATAFSSFHLFPWWYSSKLPFNETFEQELSKMPATIELPVLEIPPYSETQEFGGGNKVATVTLSFSSFIEQLKKELLSANSDGNLSIFETYELAGPAEFTVEVEKLADPVFMTYKDHIRPGQMDFVAGDLAEEVLNYGYHSSERLGLGNHWYNEN